MSSPTPQQPGSPDALQARTHAFVAVALGLVGLLGGGTISNALIWLLGDSLYGIDSGLQVLPQALVTAGFGAGALLLAARSVESGDATTIPVARTGRWLGALAVLGAVLLLLAGLVD